MTVSRFHDGKHAITYRVRLFAFGRELRIVGEDDVALAVWKFNQIEAAPELDPDGAVVLTERSRPGVLLVAGHPDLEILHHAGIWTPNRGAWSRGRWLTVCAGLLVTFAIGAVALNTLPLWFAVAMPAAWERKLGEATERLVTTGDQRCGGAVGQAALNRLVERLRAAGGVTLPVTISVIKNKTVNAFTLPGGQVLIMSGLFNAAVDGPMLAGVIAHELGHVMHHDPTTSMLRVMGLSIVLNIIGFGNPGTAAAGGATGLLNLAYTRAAETRADDTALDLLTKAGLRSDGLSRFFARMEQRETAPNGETGSRPQFETTMNWFDTHPSEESRRARTARPVTGDEPFTEAESQGIKAMCASN
jgi:Zn-dependent protease with chaperone function